MKSTPILFSGPMVRAILEGRKTQTRRVCKLPEGSHDVCWWNGYDGTRDHPGYANPGVRAVVPSGLRIISCPYGFVGDRLWVRETWGPCDGGIMYRASEPGPAKPDDGRWHPSILMPRWASRLTLEIVSVRVERLQAISEEDARAEGIECETGLAYLDRVCRNGGLPSSIRADPPPVSDYRRLWDKIEGKRAPWSSNPWVWRIEFRKVEQAAAQRSAEQ